MDHANPRPVDTSAVLGLLPTLVAALLLAGLLWAAGALAGATRVDPTPVPNVHMHGRAAAMWQNGADPGTYGNGLGVLTGVQP